MKLNRNSLYSNPVFNVKGSLFDFFYKKEETNKDQIINWVNFNPKNKNLIKLLQAVAYAGSARIGANNYYLRKLSEEELMRKLESIIR